MTEMTNRSHLDLIRRREEHFANLLHEGSFSPFLLQQAFGTLFLLFIPLFLCPASPFLSKLVRYGFHAIITCSSIYTILHVRFIGPGNGYVIGLMTTWFYIWSSTILVFNDAQKNFKRIEKEYVDVPSTPLYDPSKATSQLSEQNNTGDHSLRRRRKPLAIVRETARKCKVYRWQPFPDSLPHRVDWVLDLIFNLRGPNWNWCIRSLPPLPSTVVKDVGVEEISPHKRTPSPDVECPSAKLRHTFYLFLRDYIVLDILKVVMMRDQYFWGIVDNCPPPPWPFSILSFSPILIRTYRLLLSMTGVIFALDYIVSLSPLFFLGLSLAFPRFSRTITHQPLDEAWLYPSAFGSAMSALDHGLTGVWNTWWHQLFRFGFSESGRFISNLIIPNPNQKRRRSLCHTVTRRSIQVMVAFSLSGLVHAMSSYTAFADTRPLNAFLFFFLQGVGVLVQGLLVYGILPKVLRFKPPRIFVRTANLVALVLWFYFTGPLLADDFSRGGIWMFEPIPISPIRGALGWGIEGEGWLTWKSSWFEWWSGNTWWQSGIRFT